MRILRGLSSRMLLCGCLAGLYETYAGEIVGILDARGPSCGVSAHRQGSTLPPDALNDLPGRPGRTAEQPPPSA